MTKSWSILRDHIYYNMCDEDDNKFNWFMTWMAHIVQKPDEKYGMGVIVSGPSRSGKGAIFKYLTTIIGDNKVENAGKFSGFYPPKEGALLVINDGYNEQDIVLAKQLLSDNTRVVEAKGVNPESINNNLRFVFQTSEKKILFCDRRFVEFRMSNNPTLNPFEFYGHTSRQMARGGLQTFREELENWVPPQEDGWDCLRRAPEEAEPYAVFDLETRGIENIQSYATGGACKPMVFFDYQKKGFDEYIKKTLEYKNELIAEYCTIPDELIGEEEQVIDAEWLVAREEELADRIRAESSLNTYGPNNWTAEELIHCVDMNGIAYLAAQNNWNESDVMSWYEDACSTLISQAIKERFGSFDKGEE